jgi:hypothetical protein
VNLLDAIPTALDLLSLALLLWPWLWLVASLIQPETHYPALLAVGRLFIRMAFARNLQERLACHP